MTTMVAPPRLHPTTRYAHAVVDGSVIAGEWVRLAGARHLQDLARQNTTGFPFHFDEEEAHKAFDFFEERLCHFEGDLADEPFMLNDWQMFVIGSIFGWLDRRGNRRFRTAYIETGKGSGKTPLSAGVALKGEIDDNEPGAQVLFAGSLREQSDLPFRDCKAMAKASPGIASLLHILEHNISYPAQNGFIRPVSSEAGNLTGKRVHIGILEELHEHRDATVVNAMRKGTKARRQPLIMEITNSGMNRKSICWEHHEYSRKLLQGMIHDEQWFAYVCCLDTCVAHKAEGKDMPVDGCPDCDQWTDEKVWTKTNPSLPETPGVEYLRQQVLEAKNMASAADETKRLNFCIWTSGKVQWIRPELWKMQKPMLPIAGRVGYAGYDFSAVSDLTAAAYVFPDDDGNGLDIVVKAYLPEGRVDELAQRSRVPYRAWVDMGLITLVPGMTVNYNFVREEDRAFRAQYEIRSSGIDPHFAIQFRADLEQDGLQVHTVNQTNMGLHAVVEEVERLLMWHQFRHGDNPLLEWVASNVILNIDARGMKRLDKQASPEKIDPMAAILNAVHESMGAIQADEEAGVFFT